MLKIRMSANQEGLSMSNVFVAVFSTIKFKVCKIPDVVKEF